MTATRRDSSGNNKIFFNESPLIEIENFKDLGIKKRQFSNIYPEKVKYALVRFMLILLVTFKICGRYNPLVTIFRSLKQNFLLSVSSSAIYRRKQAMPPVDALPLGGGGGANIVASRDAPPQHQSGRCIVTHACPDAFQTDKSRQTLASLSDPIQLYIAVSLGLTYGASFLYHL